MHRGFRFKLCPTAAQAETLGQWVGVTRLIYNLALEQRRDFWRHYLANEGRGISFASQCRELTDLRAEVPWIAETPRVMLEAALKDLDNAYAAFFRGAAYPRPRQLGVSDTSRIRGPELRARRLNAKWSEIKLPKIGWVRFRQTRALVGEMRTATLQRRSGGWSVSFACGIGQAPAALSALPAVGIDRGISNTLSLSTGEHVRLPNTDRLDRRKRRAQAVMARRKRGSKRYCKQRRRIGRISAQIARIRDHGLHVASAAVAQRYGVVGLEDLKIVNMTARARNGGVRQKAGLNRSILAQGWGRFATMLEYKLEAAGGRLVYVPAAHTSQTCQACGVVDRQSRKSQAVFACVHCGHEAHADTNAALEIRRRSTALLLAEGGHLGPAVEPRTLAA